MWDVILAYGILFLAAAVTFGTLVKDARDYLEAIEKHGRWLLWSVYACAFLLFLAGIFQTHGTRKQAWLDRKQAQQDRDRLTADRAQAQAVEAVNQARLSDASKSLEKLQEKVDRLQTKAETIQLSRELSDVETELRDAKSKLQQPRANFVASFATPDYQKIPIREAIGERTPEGIKVNFGVMNASDVAAVKGMIVLRLCDACQFGGEPAGFVKGQNAPEDERFRVFDTILEHAIIQDMAATIIPPLGGTPRFEVIVMVKCTNCEPGRWNRLSVIVPPVVPPDFHKKNPSSKKKPT